GASLAWPERPPDAGPRPQRAAGAKVILRDGALVGWMGRREEALLTFLPSEEPLASACANDLVAAVAGLVTSSASRRVVLLATIDGIDASTHALAPRFQRAGFVRKTDRALFLRRHSETHLELRGG